MINPVDKGKNADGGGNEPVKKTLAQLAAEDADVQADLDKLIQDRLKRDREAEDRKRAASTDVEKKLVELETQMAKMTSDNTLAIERANAAKTKAENDAATAAAKLAEIAKENQNNLVKSEIKKALQGANMRADLIDDYTDVLFLRGKPKLDGDKFVDVEFSEKDAETLPKQIAKLVKDKPSLIKATMGPGNNARGNPPHKAGGESKLNDAEKQAARIQFANRMKSTPKSQRGALLEELGLTWNDVGVREPASK